MEPPDSIPNSEVKRRSADDSCGATCRENMSSPDQCSDIQSMVILHESVVIQIYSIIDKEKERWK